MNHNNQVVLYGYVNIFCTVGDGPFIKSVGHFLSEVGQIIRTPVLCWQIKLK